MNPDIALAENRPLNPIWEPPWRAGESLPAEIFAQIRTRVLLEHCKWDAQMGDIGTLADFPLVLRADTWRTLASMAEALAAEVLAAENELLQRPALLKQLGLPRKLRAALESVAFLGPTREAARTMRFDFHLTTEGWRISEANSDVPGGFTEASNFTRMIAAHFPLFAPAGDPLAEWSRAIAHAACQQGLIALLTAPGFMEDHQIMACLAKKLAEKGCNPLLANPRQLDWRGGRAFLDGTPCAALVRFYQAEWLSELPRRCGWSHFFSGGKTPVANPGQGVLAESKRFPLAWDQMKTSLPMWRALLPETRDPRDANWQTDDDWLLKSALCNTGDTVSIRSLMHPRQWTAVVRDAWRHPQAWVAQKRFESQTLATPWGQMFPCIGVYTIDGKAAGAYARLARKPVVDFEAADVALLLDNSVEGADA